VDKSNEVMDYTGSKPYFEDWTNYFAKATEGKSYGNVRLQHDFKKPIGKVVAPIEFLDESKAIRMLIKVLDNEVWDLVEEGVLTGASIGGKLIKKWFDPAIKAFRYIVKPSEVSLVDTPCNPSSGFILVKTDGTTESRVFKNIERTNEMSKKEVIKNLLPSEIQKVFQGTDGEKRERIYGALNEKIKVPYALANQENNLWFWIRDVYADKVIIEGNLDGDRDDDLYSVGYTISDDGVVTIAGELVQVRVEYVPTVDELTPENHAEEPTVGKTEEDNNMQKTEEITEKTAEVVEKAEEGAAQETVEVSEQSIEKTEAVAETIIEKVEDVKTEEVVEKSEDVKEDLQKVEEVDIQKSVNDSKDNLVKVFHNLTEMGVRCTCEKCSKVYNEDMVKTEVVEKTENSDKLAVEIEALKKTVTDLSAQNTQLLEKVEKLENSPNDSNVPASYAVVEKALGGDNQVEKADTSIDPMQKLNQVWGAIKQNPTVGRN
jgi:hypothetical protein